MAENVFFFDQYRVELGTQSFALPNVGEDTMFSGGNGGGSDVNSELIDAKVAAAEARVDAKFAELSGKLDRLPSFGALVTTVAGAVIAAITIVLAVLSYGGDRFDSGIGLSDERQTQMQRDADQDRAVANMNKKLDVLIAGQKADTRK